MRINLRGQSLVELLIAMFVIIVGLTAAGAIIFSNLRIQEIASDRVVATNLAREGIEFVREIRDSNWLSGSAFNTGMANVTDYTAVPVWSAGTFAGLNFSPTTIADTSWTTIKLSTHASTTNALYVQGASYPGTDTLYRRLLTIQPICSDSTVRTEGFSCLSPLTTIGVRITSLVSWTKRGQTRNVDAVEELYDWR